MPKTKHFTCCVCNETFSIEKLKFHNKVTLFIKKLMFKTKIRIHENSGLNKQV